MAKKTSKKAGKKTSKKAPAKAKAEKKSKAPAVEPILIFDTETGGLDPQKHSLLTVAFAAVNPKTWEILSSIDLKVKHDEYIIQGKGDRKKNALMVNKIDLAKHDSDKKSVTPKQAVTAIIEFLESNFSKIPVSPAGQNTPFDIAYVTKLFESVGGEYEKYIHYSYLDSMPILRFLHFLGDLPASACSLQGAKRHFKIAQKRSAAHDALGDVQATAEVFKALQDLLGGPADEIDNDEEDEPAPAKKAKKTPAKKKSKKVEEEEEEEDEDEDEDDEDVEDLDELDEDDEDEDEDEDEDDDDEDDDDEEDDDDKDEDEDEEDDDEGDDWED